MNEFENLGFFDFEDFVSELSDEQLIAVNGGACGGGGAVTPSTPHYSGSCSGGGAVTSSPSPSYSYPTPSGACGGGYISNRNSIPYVSEESSKYQYICIEGVGVNGVSLMTTNAGLNSKGQIEVTALGNFIGKNLVDASSFFGRASLVVDGKVVETKAYGKDTVHTMWDGNYSRVGMATFDYNISNAKSIQIISDVDLKITSYGLGNTIVNYSPTTVVLR